MRSQSLRYNGSVCLAGRPPLPADLCLAKFDGQSSGGVWRCEDRVVNEGARTGFYCGDTDVLEIVRTWQFRGNFLRST